MRTPEYYEKKDIDDFFKSLGPDCWFCAPLMKGYGKNGVPDRVGCYKGRLFGIEVKRAEDTPPTPIQKRRMQEIRDAGGIAIAGPASVVIPTFKQAFGV
jgi:hypothetical protein